MHTTKSMTASVVTAHRGDKGQPSTPSTRTRERAPWRALALGLALLTGMAGAAQASDLGFDPDHFKLRYGVNGLGSPVYKVVETDVYHLNTSQTPLLLPCQVQEFEFVIAADSTPDSAPVYWNVAISFFQPKANNTEKQVVSHGCLNNSTFDTAAAGIGLINPNTSVEAGLIPLNTGGPYCAGQFQSGDLKKNTPIRMQVELGLFADPGFSTPVADTDLSNNVFNFWVERACGK
jgi:hypothetical protein